MELKSAQTQLEAAKASFFASCKDRTPQQECSLLDVVTTVRSDTYAAEIAAIRAAVAEGRTEEAAKLKHALPAVAASVVVFTRDASAPVEKRFGAHNGFLQIDIDGKDNPALADNYEAVREKLKSDPHVAAGFRSPSGNGIKLLFRIAPSKTAHKRSWIAAERWFRDNYGLKIDRAASDVARLCFLSHDPDAWIADAPAEALPPAASEIPSASAARSSLSDVADIEEMLGYISYRPDYSDWLRIASAVWNTVGEADGTALLKKYFPEERPGEYEKKFEKRLSTITLGTLVHYASLSGYDVRAAAAKKRWAGRICFARDGKSCAPEKIVDARLDDVSAEVADTAPVVVTQIFVQECFDRQQRGDAELFAAVQKGCYEYDHLALAWRHYADGIWTRDEENAALIDLQDTVSAAYRERVRALEIDARADDADPKTVAALGKKILAFRKRIEKLYTRAYASAVLEIAASLLANKSTAYDADPFLVACRNKTIDLALGEARPHSPKDHLTISLDADFDPDAACPAWDNFLRDIFLGDDDLIGYIRRIVGYCLSGSTSEDLMFFLIGGGANGKSTFKSAIEMLFGEYSSSIKISALLTQTSDSNVDYQKATMKGKRVVWTDEVPEGKRFNESQIKAMVGTDKILARAIFEKPFEFTPTHKLFPIGNHVPTITGTDNGIWRRIVLIPFGATFSETASNAGEKKRRNSEDILRELRAELPGILNWALRGWLDYSVRGLRDRPQSVIDATQSYRDSQDQIACFLDECYETAEPDEKIKATEIYSVYTHWCAENGETPTSKTKRHLLTKLREQKVEVRRSTGGYYYIFGLRRILEAPSLSQHPSTFAFYR